jgi:hypothetical protein
MVGLANDWKIKLRKHLNCTQWAKTNMRRLFPHQFLPRISEDERDMGQYCDSLRFIFNDENDGEDTDGNMR